MSEPGHSRESVKRPRVAKSRKPYEKKPSLASLIPLETRLEHGFLSVNETCGLGMVSRSSLYADARKGLITLDKRGTRTRVHGKEVVRYLNAKSGE